MQQPDKLDWLAQSIRDGQNPEERLEGYAFVDAVLSALGLGGTKRITNLQLEFDGQLLSVKVTRLVTREQGAAVTALLKQRRWWMLGEPQDVGELPIDGAAPDQALRPTRVICPPEL